MDEQQHRKPKTASVRSFVLTFFAVLMLVSLWPLLSGNAPRWWALLTALAIIISGTLRPQLFVKPNFYWGRFGNLLSRVASPVVTGLLFIVVFFPVGFLMKLFRYDPLYKRPDKTATTYWIDRTEQPGPMRLQY